MVTGLLEDCTLCPRNCHISRSKGNKGFCGQDSGLVVARAALHMWEEPCISGQRGSGTIFFSGCHLGCVYCQNYQISHGSAGKRITAGRLADIFMERRSQGAHNINLVSPTHFTPQIIEAIENARGKGFNLPVVWNTSGYEKPETLKLLEGYVDIWLPDLKYRSEELSQKYSRCKDYFLYASKAIREMLRQTGKPEFDAAGMMKKGIIVRHLVLPGCVEDSKEIIRYLHENFGDAIYISIMSQYTPVAPIQRYPELNRKITGNEYDEVVDYAISIGVENGFIQEGETASESFIPDFDGQGV